MTEEKATAEQTAPETAPETAQETAQETPKEAPEAAPEKAQEGAVDGGAKEAGEAQLEALRQEFQGLQERLTGQETRHQADLQQARRQADLEVATARTEWERKHAAELLEAEADRYQKEIEDGDSTAIPKLREAYRKQRALTLQEEEAEKARQTAQVAQGTDQLQGYYTGFARRIDALNATPEQRQRFSGMWTTGDYEGLEKAVGQAEIDKAGGTETMAELKKRLDALEKGTKAATEEETAMAEREEGGADLGGGTPGGTDLNEARQDYADGKTSKYPG